MESITDCVRFTALVLGLRGLGVLGLRGFRIRLRV